MRCARAATAVLVVAALTVGAAGCTAAPAPVPAATWAGTAELEQGRFDRGTGTIGLRLSATAGAVVRRVRVDAGGGAVAWRGRLVLTPGRTTTVRLPVPPPSCPADAAPAVRAILLVEAADGSLRRLIARPTDPYGAVARLAEEGCAQRAVARVAAVTGTAVEQRGRGRDAAASLVVEVVPTGRAGRVELGDVLPTVLLRPPADEAAAWRLGTDVDGTDAPRTLRLPVEPARCDAHAVAEDKVGTVLEVRTRTDPEGDGDPVEGVVALRLASGVKEALLHFVAERCGLTGRSAGDAEGPR